MTVVGVAAGLTLWATVFLGLTLVELRDNESGNIVRRALLATLISAIVIVVGMAVTS